MQDSSLIYLALPCHLVLGKENPGNVPKRLEQFLEKMIQTNVGVGISNGLHLQVGFLGIF